MSNRYLVTGCAGFIGSKVTELLLQDGHQVVGVDNVNDAYDPRLKTWRLDRLNPGLPPGVEVQTGLPLHPLGSPHCRGDRYRSLPGGVAGVPAGEGIVTWLNRWEVQLPRIECHF